MYLWFVAQAEVPTLSDQGSWTAWATAVGMIIAAVTSFVTAILVLYWTKGSKARIAETREQTAYMKAEALVKQAEKVAREVDFAKLEEHYKEMLGQAQTLAMLRYTEIKKDAADKYSELKSQNDRLQEHQSILDSKLENCESKHLECVQKASYLEGKLAMIEQVQTDTCAKVQQLEERSKHDARGTDQRP
jgi:mannitol-specific phosphotransferase system IIBC component